MPGGTGATGAKRMIKLFGGKPDHPLAEPREARAILDAAAAEEPLKGLEELAHWFDSVYETEAIKPDYRAQLLLQIDETAQAHLRKLSREYLSSARLSKFQEGRLWAANHGYWQHCAAAFSRFRAQPAGTRHPVVGLETAGV